MTSPHCPDRGGHSPHTVTVEVGGERFVGDCEGRDGSLPPRCLERPFNASDTACKGEVEYRESLSGTGTPIARCDGHWAARLDQHQAHLERYPDSPHAPSWHDPSYAGEVWSDDDY